MRDPYSAPYDIKLEDFLDTMYALGVDSEEGENGSHILSRMELTAAIFPDRGWVQMEAVFEVCKKLRIDFTTFYLHHDERCIRGDP